MRVRPPFFIIAVIMLMCLSACSEAPLNGASVAATKGCVACHGQNGRATAPIYPNLNGQWESYLRQQLIAYRSGRRTNVVMNGMAASLTDAEIRTLAAHYGR